MSRAHRGLNRKRWERVRLEVLERDLYRCTACGKAGALEVDHITPLQREPMQDPFDVHGLQSLCRGCHIDKSRGERPVPPERRAWQALIDARLTETLRPGAQQSTKSGT